MIIIFRGKLERWHAKGSQRIRWAKRIQTEEIPFLAQNLCEEDANGNTR